MNVKSGNARPGRPRSEQSRQAVLRAASDLLHDVGLRAMTTEDIAAKSGVSKATIYKWWPNKYAVAIESFTSRLAIGSMDPDTGSAREDFRQVLVALVAFYSTPTGRVLAQLVGEAQFDPQVAAELRDRLMIERRPVLGAIWARGVVRGEVRADVDPEVAIELITGPVLYRLFAGHAPLTPSLADAVVDAAMRGLAGPTTQV